MVAAHCSLLGAYQHAQHAPRRLLRVFYAYESGNFLCMCCDLSYMCSGRAIHMPLFLNASVGAMIKSKAQKQYNYRLPTVKSQSRDRQLLTLQLWHSGKHAYHSRRVLASCRWPCTATRHSIHMRRQPTRSCSAKAAWWHSTSPTCEQQENCISSMTRRKAVPWRVGDTAQICCIVALWHGLMKTIFGH